MRCDPDTRRRTRHTCDMRGFAIGVIEQDQVTERHLVAHQIPSLVVPHTVPMGEPIRDERRPWVDVEFRFHEPMRDITKPPVRHPSSRR